MSDIKKEFKALNLKVNTGAATDQERARWKELKEEVFAGKEKTPGRRRHMRAPISLRVNIKSDKALIEAASYELGAGGLALRLSRAFAKDSSVTLDITLPGDDSAVSIPARVVWSTGKLTGFEFVDIDPKIQDRIDSIVWEDLDLSDL